MRPHFVWQKTQPNGTKTRLNFNVSEDFLCYEIVETYVRIWFLLLAYAMRFYDARDMRWDQQLQLQVYAVRVCARVAAEWQPFATMNNLGLLNCLVNIPSNAFFLNIFQQTRIDFNPRSS